MALTDRRISSEVPVSYLQQTLNLVIDELCAKDSSILLLQKRIATLEKKLSIFECETHSINHYLADGKKLPTPVRNRGNKNG
jgi:hypothetical protein